MFTWKKIETELKKLERRSWKHSTVISYDIKSGLDIFDIFIQINIPFQTQWEELLLQTVI